MNQNIYKKIVLMLVKEMEGSKFSKFYNKFITEKNLD
jgi:hypothetical protein